MPIDMSWLVKDKVVLLKFRGDITVDDMSEVSAQYITMLDTADGDWLIHALHDAEHMESLPKILKDTVNASREAFKHPRSGWTIAYNVNKPIIKLLGNMATGVLRVRYRIVETYADALKTLREKDATLPSLIEQYNEEIG